VDGVLLTGQGALGGRVLYEVFRRLHLVPVVLVFHIDVVPGLGAIIQGAIPFIFAGGIRNKSQQVVYFLLRVSSNINSHQQQS